MAPRFGETYAKFIEVLYFCNLLKDGQSDERLTSRLGKKVAWLMSIYSILNLVH